ncbi:MAG: hypothetical protein BGO56_08050 [Sphingobacteriales bacterium 48-107]|nr:MAG: hypothetical protein BGO56_08050 [Sphingobacteriales bacterium 48-107]
MWIGTQDGLNRYDGKEFKVYWPGTKIGKKLPSNYISALYFDSEKNLLWIGTIEGMCLYHPLGDSLALVTELFPFASALSNAGVKKILSFKKNEYWVITFNKGLFFINTKTKTLQSFFDNSVYHNQVTAITFHENKVIVSLMHNLFHMVPSGSGFIPEALLPQHRFAEIKELYSFNGSLWIGTLTAGCFYISDSLTAAASVRRLETGAEGIGCFTTDNEGTLWIGSRGKGIIRYDPVKQTFQRAIHSTYDNRTPGKNFVLSLFKDRQGIIWCGLSGSGLAKHDPLKYQFTSINNEPVNNSSLPDNMVIDIFKTRDSFYYVGTQNNGITEWNPKKNEFIIYPASHANSATDNIIYDIAEDEKNNLWIASWGGLMQFERKAKKIIHHKNENLIASKKLYALVKLKNADSLFIASEAGPVFYSLKDKSWKPCPADLLPSNINIGRYNLFTCRYIYEDNNNILWICTVGAGLVKYDYRNHKVQVIEPVRKISTYARHLLRDGPLFWIATDKGVVLYNFETNEIKRHIIPNAFAGSKVCYAVQKDKQGFFWVSTNMGLYKINPVSYNVEKNYNLGNGLSFLEYNTACTLADDDGTLMFGGIGGITTFNPALLKENTYSPAPLITDIRINDKSVELSGSPSHLEKLSLTYNENFITLQFAVNNFSNHLNNQFSYRLQGLTNNWTNAGNRNFATYTSLPPGNYSFELRSANSDGKWSTEVTMLTIVIHPPWWQTWLFRASLILLVTGLIVYFLKRRIKTIRRDTALKLQFAELEIKGLHAQMNPHFIFNSLNSIKEMILEDQKQNASRYLSKFAQLIRTNLEQSRQAFVTVRQCIDHLEQYLQMEKLRFDSFSYSIEVEGGMSPDEINMAPMLIQPLVENAIWHGLRNKNGDKQLRVLFYIKDSQLFCEIEDNGIGILQSKETKFGTQATHRSVGIINIRERLAVLNEKYKMNCSLQIIDKSTLPEKRGTGTIAILQFTL